MSKPKNIDEYIGDFPKEVQKILNQLRATINKAAPDAEEVISYAIPTFKIKGQKLVYFAGYKNHISIYPAPRDHDAFKKDLSNYKGGKGTIQFPLDKPLPVDLITRIVKFRVKENLEKQKKESLKNNKLS